MFFFDNSQKSNGDMFEQITTFVELGVHPALGLAIVLTNIALLILYKHKSQTKEITLVFLSNLTISDIIFGIMLLVRFTVVLTGLEYQIEACRLILSFGAMSVTMSGWCIFLLSCQVSNFKRILQSFPKETQLFSVDFSWGPGSGSCNLGSWETPDSLVYTLLQKKGNFRNVAILLEKTVWHRLFRIWLC